jgi:hypothetical protein
VAASVGVCASTGLTAAKPMAVTGAPGIYRGKGGSVLVAGFTTETAPTVTGGR